MRKVCQFKPYIDPDDIMSLADSFDENWITEGPKSKEFNKKLCDLIGCKYGVFANNGTLSLYLGLKAMGIKPGDEVIVPDFTFIASANAVEMVGAKPIFVDINKDDLSTQFMKINAKEKDINVSVLVKNKSLMVSPYWEKHLGYKDENDIPILSEDQISSIKDSINNNLNNLTNVSYNTLVNLTNAAFFPFIKDEKESKKFTENFISGLYKELTREESPKDKLIEYVIILNIVKTIYICRGAQTIYIIYNILI